MTAPPRGGARTATARQARERGAGLIGTIGAVMVFFALLTFAVQMLVNLYATSAVTAVAHDAAAMAASGQVDRADADAVAAAVRDAEVHARRLLGRYGERARFRWDVSGDRVRLTVSVAHARIAISPVADVFGLNEVERSVEVRVEAPR